VRKKGIIFVLLAIIAINSLSLQEFLKIPVLVAHYFEHQQRGPSITFIEYLSMHYGGKDINDNDQDRDMQLPFKKVDLSHASQTLFAESEVELVTDILPLTNCFTFLEPQLHSSTHLGSLFKPPRLV
jgi:hypothetical protein